MSKLEAWLEMAKKDLTDYDSALIHEAIAVIEVLKAALEKIAKDFELDGESIAGHKSAYFEADDILAIDPEKL